MLKGIEDITLLIGRGLFVYYRGFTVCLRKISRILCINSYIKTGEVRLMLTKLYGIKSVNRLLRLKVNKKISEDAMGNMKRVFLKNI